MLDVNVLNDMQRQAVDSLEGPLLVLAGAGSGKTRALTYRIANLVEHGVSPYSILALTFTNKAASEMRERVEELVGADASDMWVTTFHSCCVRILRRDIDKLGRERSFVIYDDADQLSVIGEIMKRLGISDKEIPKREIKTKISDAKNKSEDPEQYLMDDSYSDTSVVKIFRLYQKALLEANAMDFDDLLLITLKLFTESPEALEKYRGRFRYVLVDEYQDTNSVQYRLIELLCRDHGNICVVGDDDQSIYGWRGADIRNILGFEKDFPGAKIIRLEQNYRSSANILNAANSVISHNIGRKPKKLWTTKGEGEQLVLYSASTEREEADFICKQILSAAREGRKYGDCAVLYRMNAQSRVIESMLVNYGIPYKVYGGVRFYERREIKDMLAYLRLLQNPADNVALMRVINVPRRGIGAASISELSQAAEEQGIPMLLCAISGEGISAKLHNKLKPFVDTILQFTAMQRTIPLSEFTERMIVSLEYEEYLKAEDKKGELESRMDNLRELIGNIKEFETGAEDEESVLSSFLENVALIADIDGMQEGSDAVALMTLHSAKGLEFDIVFIPGMEENVFPSSRACNDLSNSGLEEERRLCYVGITRARERLYLLNAKQRSLFGNYSWNRPSRFLEEIPAALINDLSPRFSPEISGGGEHPQHENSTWGKREKTVRVPPSNGFGVHKPASGAAAALNKAVPKSFELHQRVKHDKFGEGTIMEISGSGNAMTVYIDFNNGEKKKFAAAYAPIKAIE